MIALPCALYAVDLTVLDLTLPAISADLRPTNVELLWIVDVYGFLVAGSLITMGALGDRVGRRRVLMVGASAFGAASVLAAYATSPRTLIAARALQCMAGATFAPSTLSLIRTMFDDPRERTIAISVWATSYSVGTAAGPLLGGLLLTRFGWGVVFLPAVPVMLLLLALGRDLLPEFRDPDARGIDLPSAALSLAASLVVYALGTFVAFGSFLYVTLYMQVVLGLDPLRVAFWIAPVRARHRRVRQRRNRGLRERHCA